MLDELIQSLDLAILVLGADNEVRMLNDAAADLLGGTRDDLQHQELSQLFAADTDLTSLLILVDQARKGGSPEPLLLPLDVGYGTRCVQLDAALVPRTEGVVRVLLRDASHPDLQAAEHRHTLEALERSNQRLSLIFQHSPYLICLMRSDGTFSYVNRVLEGYDIQQILTAPTSLLAPEELTAFAAAVQTVFAEGTQSHVECQDIHGRWWDARFIPTLSGPHQPREAMVFITDITDQRRAAEEKARLDAQYQHAQKLESLGVLAGGVAHDFNNLLSGILGNAELAERMLATEHPATMFVEEIIRTADRAGELCRQLLAYSGKGSFVVRPTRFSEVVTNMTNLLKVSIPKRVSLRYDFSDQLPAVEADVSQLQQIVMNLVTNAADAIGDGPGVITVRTGNTFYDRAALASTFIDDNLPEGEYVYLEVADNGCGIDPTTQRRIFEPFFSSKGTGRGLGLAAVLGIVRGHAGAIVVNSEPGLGTTVRVILPASILPARQPRPTAPRRAPSQSLVQTALIVDDEKAVLSMVEQALKHGGYRVLTAVDGEAAIEVFDEHGESIDIVLLDLTMPRLDGEQTYLHMKAKMPDLPIILMSGYSEQAATRRFVHNDQTPFLAKPFRIADLLNLVRSLIHKPAQDT